MAGYRVSVPLRGSGLVNPNHVSTLESFTVSVPLRGSGLVNVKKLKQRVIALGLCFRPLAG